MGRSPVNTCWCPSKLKLTVAETAARIELSSSPGSVLVCSARQQKQELYVDVPVAHGHQDVSCGLLSLVYVRQTYNLWYRHARLLVGVHRVACLFMWRIR